MEMPNQIDALFFAPCGVNCFVCYVHLKEKRPCNGCLGSDLNKPRRCIDCKIKKCVHSRKINYCFECTDYPCKIIKNLEKSYIARYNVSLIENCKTVKSLGVDRFQEQEKLKWGCTDCGGVISQHDGFCSECKKRIIQWI